MHSVCVNGCFKLPRLQNAGAATVHEPAYQDVFMSDAEVRHHGCQKPQLPAAAAQQCNDFHADKVLGRKHKKYDVTGVQLACCSKMHLLCCFAKSHRSHCTGVFAICCRHGISLKALNMATREKWAYATMLLDRLFQQGNVPEFLW